MPSINAIRSGISVKTPEAQPAVASPAVENQPAQVQDGFDACRVIDVKGNNSGGRPTVTKAASDCFVPPPPTTITV